MACKRSGVTLRSISGTLPRSACIIMKLHQRAPFKDRRWQDLAAPVPARLPPTSAMRMEKVDQSSRVANISSTLSLMTTGMHPCKTESSALGLQPSPAVGKERHLMCCRAGKKHHGHSLLLCPTWSDQAEFAGRKPLAVASRGFHITGCNDNVIISLPVVNLG